jgi:hypothetical protein
LSIVTAPDGTASALPLVLPTNTRLQDHYLSLMQYLHSFLVAASCANVGSKTLISLNDVPKSTFAAAAAKPLNGMTLYLILRS